MTKAGETGRDTDPFETWRQLYDANEKAWSAALEEAMGSPEFGASSGKMLETMLAAQKSVRDNMRTYLESMNVPTREDIARLGELVIGVEEKLDQLADRFDAIEDALRSARAKAPAPAKAPPRAKAPARKKPTTGAKTRPRTQAK
jgi:polyhydroxyalkanoic acid synthase PhaR subunit